MSLEIPLPLSNFVPMEKHLMGKGLGVRFIQIHHHFGNACSAGGIFLRSVFKPKTRRKEDANSLDRGFPPSISEVFSAHWK